MRRFLLSAFGIGFLPAMPGTWASAATAIAVAAAGRGFGHPLLAPFVAVVLGSVVTLALSRAPGQTGGDLGDPSWIVMDEVAGQGVALVPAAILAGTRWEPEVMAFVLFRVFDVWKPGPIRRLERLPGGLGILADDLAAGALAGVLVGVACAVGAFGR